MIDNVQKKVYLNVYLNVNVIFVSPDVTIDFFF